MDQSDIGGGASFCSISPSDNVGIIENFLRRIEELEKTVSQLSASNITADRLSDLSQQIGWVTGIEYLGVPGWSQTEYGTLVPPVGFSFFPNDGSGWLLSDGNRYQGVSYDSDGVMQFGFMQNGNVSGAALSGGKFLVLSFSQSMTTFNEYLTFDTQEKANGITWSGTTINCPAGLILVTVYMSCTWSGTPTDDLYWEVETVKVPNGTMFINFNKPPDNTSTSDAKTVVFYKNSSGNLRLRYKNTDDATISGFITVCRLGQ